MSITSKAKKITELYFSTVLGTMIIVAIFISLELIANFQGWLWIPGLGFLAILLLQQIIKNSPPTILFSGVISLYTLIPFVGDLSVGKTFSELHTKVKKMIDDVCTAMALISLFLFVVYIDSDHSTQIVIAFCFLMGFAVLSWWSIKTKSESKLIWKFVLIAGLLTVGKATALLYPMPIHDLLGIYPGIVVDKSAIRAATKTIAQQDAGIENKRNTATITAFEAIVKKLPMKKSTEIIRDRNTLLQMQIITPAELNTIESEMRRRENRSPKTILRKTVRGTQNIYDEVRDTFTKTVFDEEVFPQFGGAPLVIVKPGYAYTVTFSGKHKQWECDDVDPDNCYYVTIQPNGILTNFNRTEIINKPAYHNIDGTQPAGMAVVMLNNKHKFAHNNIIQFTPIKTGTLKLTANCQQERKFFAKSIGTWHVKVTRKAI